MDWLTARLKEFLETAAQFQVKCTCESCKPMDIRTAADALHAFIRKNSGTYGPKRKP